MSTAAQRKARSEEICRAEDVPVNPNLPLVESEQECNLRPIAQVVLRAVSLFAVAMKGEGAPPSLIDQLIRDYDLMNHLSQQEHAFISNRDSEKRDLDTFSWRYESCWALLWSLGLVEEPLRPDQQCNVEIMYEILTEKGSELTERANFRSLAEILDYLDLIYRYDWACVEARLNGQDAPGDLDPGIVYERHYALNWLVNYMSQDWDEVTCDT